MGNKSVITNDLPIKKFEVNLLTLNNLEFLFIDYYLLF